MTTGIDLTLLPDQHETEEENKFSEFADIDLNILPDSGMGRHDLSFSNQVGPAFKLGTAGMLKGIGQGMKATGIMRQKRSEEMHPSLQWMPEEVRHYFPEYFPDPNKPERSKPQNHDLVADALKYWSEPIIQYGNELIAKHSEWQRPLELQRNWTDLLKDPETRWGYLARALGENAPNLVAGATVGAVTGLVTKNPAAALSATAIFTYTIETGFAFEELVKLAGSEEEAAEIAQYVGFVNALLETAPIANLFAKIPGLRRIFSKTITEGLAKDPLLMRMLREGLTQAALEGGTEGLQEFVGNIGKRVFNENQDLFEGMDESAFIGSLLGGGAGTAAQTLPGGKDGDGERQPTEEAARPQEAEQAEKKADQHEAEIDKSVEARVKKAWRGLPKPVNPGVAGDNERVLKWLAQENRQLGESARRFEAQLAFVYMDMYPEKEAREAAALNAAIMEARARNWAAITGKHPEDFWANWRPAARALHINTTEIDGSGLAVDYPTEAPADLRIGKRKPPRDIVDMAWQAGNAYGIDPRLLLAVAKTESNFNPRAIGPVTEHGRARGMMQFMPGTAKDMGLTDPHDTEESIRAAARYLKDLVDQFGDIELALAAYNAGPANVEKYGGIPPFQETRNYVRQIIKDYQTTVGEKKRKAPAGESSDEIRMDPAGGDTEGMKITSDGRMIGVVRETDDEGGWLYQVPPYVDAGFERASDYIKWLMEQKEPKQVDVHYFGYPNRSVVNEMAKVTDREIDIPEILVTPERAKEDQVKHKLTPEEWDLVNEIIENGKVHRARANRQYKGGAGVAFLKEINGNYYVVVGTWAPKIRMPERFYIEGFWREKKLETALDGLKRIAPKEKKGKSKKKKERKEFIEQKNNGEKQSDDSQPARFFEHSKMNERPIPGNESGTPLLPDKDITPEKGSNQDKKSDEPEELNQERGGRIKGGFRIDEQGRAILAFFQAKDFSTAPHEIGHFFLRDLEDLANDPNSPDWVRRDYETACRWVGAKPGQKWTRAQHEKWARGFEKYLAEGRAPIPELQGVFDLFRDWLLRIYKTLDSLDVELSDEMRRVFDRMLSTEDEIRAARELANNQPLFENKAIIDDGYDEYKEMAARARRATEEAVKKKREDEARRDLEMSDWAEEVPEGGWLYAMEPTDHEDEAEFAEWVMSQGKEFDQSKCFRRRRISPEMVQKMKQISGLEIESPIILIPAFEIYSEMKKHLDLTFEDWLFVREVVNEADEFYRAKRNKKYINSQGFGFIKKIGAKYYTLVGSWTPPSKENPELLYVDGFWKAKSKNFAYQTLAKNAPKGTKKIITKIIEGDSATTDGQTGQFFEQHKAERPSRFSRRPLTPSSSDITSEQGSIQDKKPEESEELSQERGGRVEEKIRGISLAAGGRLGVFSGQLEAERPSLNGVHQYIPLFKNTPENEKKQEKKPDESDQLNQDRGGRIKGGFRIDEQGREIFAFFQTDEYKEMAARAGRAAEEAVKKKRECEVGSRMAGWRAQGREMAKQHPVHVLMDDIVKRGGLREEDLLFYYEEETIREITKKRVGLVWKNGKLSLDLLAEEYRTEYGFKNSSDLLAALLETPSKKELVEDYLDTAEEEYLAVIDFEVLGITDEYIELLDMEIRALTNDDSRQMRSSDELKKSMEQRVEVWTEEELAVCNDNMKRRLKDEDMAARMAYQDGRLEEAGQRRNNQRRLAIEIRVLSRGREEFARSKRFIMEVLQSTGVSLGRKKRILNLLSRYDPACKNPFSEMTLLELRELSAEVRRIENKK